MLKLLVFNDSKLLVKLARLGRYEFPEATLTSCVELATRIQAELGGEARRDGLAHYLGMSAGGGAFAARIAALRAWGLTTGRSLLRLTGDGKAVASLGDPVKKSETIGRLVRSVPLLTELHKSLGDQPLNRGVLTVSLQEITDAPLNQVLRRTPLIERIFADVRPYLHEAPSSGAGRNPEERLLETVDQTDIGNNTKSARAGWIDLVFDDGTLSLKENPANIDVLIQALVTRKRRL